MHWLAGFTKLLLAFFYHHELLALFLILFVEETGVPMPPPGYTLLILAGARPGRSFLSALLVVAVASLAAFAGSYASFYLTRRFGRERLFKYARFLRVKQSRMEQMERWMDRYGRVGVFAGRLIPGLRTPTIFIAGLAGMRCSTYAVIDAVAAVLWAAAYFWIGALIEPKRNAIIHFAVHAMDNPWPVALVAGTSVAVIVGVRAWLKRQRSPTGSSIMALVARPRRRAIVSSALDSLERGSEMLPQSLAADTDPSAT
jgi:membrane protein DedA with SNARE-associated domain